MDTINMTLKDAALLREFANRDEVPIGTDSETQFEILKEYIEEFQDSLDSEHEVGMLLTNFGQNILLKVTFISFESPSLMIFKGYVGDKEATLIQHVNQLNFLLKSVPRDSDHPKRKIGFASYEE